ncbi:hypothetical protein [Lentzea sp.]|uniref:hypothetical protein n=1 Tax=Lentzea sp. TaxID=56099 RepID=UPI002CFC0A09|nr:hypothetical protein [Lentzea sp.]HUQ61687.1 hypothetical protein [Lentzea sp.]
MRQPAEAPGPAFTKADFAEPVAQRLIGSAPPILSAAPSAKTVEPAAQRAPAPRTLPVPEQPPAVQQLQTLQQQPPPRQLPVVARTAEPAQPERAPDPVVRQEVVQRVEAAPVVQNAEAPAGPAPAQSADELLRKLYDPLLRRLKADLWLDRERRGALTDL